MRATGFLGITLLCTMLLGAAGDSGGAGPAAGLRVRTTAGTLEMVVSCADTFVSGKENPLHVVITNNGDDTVDYSEQGPLMAVTFDVTGNGRKVDGTMLYQSWTNNLVIRGRMAPGHLKKGDTLKVDVNMTRLFDFSVPGDYQIVAHWSSLDVRLQPAGAITPDPVKVKVIE